MADRGIPLSAVCPRYLHTNSTTHKWPFSAVAELIDNAYDPDVKAKQIWIDKTTIKNEDCLVFMDNGAGMDDDKLHKMLSFGFNDKKIVGNHVPVGYYGNGFKAGSMRLGKDAIVFTKQSKTMCVGLLSQTYLKKINAQNVIVPIVKFTYSEQIEKAVPEHMSSLNDILHYSLFNTIEELLAEFKIIDEQCSKSSGTRIIIWNLHKKSSEDSKEPLAEFDFTHDEFDIRLPVVCEDTMEKNKQAEYDKSVPESKYSLRAYCSVLYLKPRINIILRGKKVQTQYISKSLAYTQKDTYKPTFLKNRIVITFGYNTKSKEQYGLMMYYHNRLIKAYERAACQLKAEDVGVGVIGVIECNYLSPSQNKQEFEDSDIYRKTMQSLSNKLEDYYKEIRHRLKKNLNCTTPAEDIAKQPDKKLVNCDSCLKWRKLPDDTVLEELPEKWYCHMNPDPEFRSCDKEEESEDSEGEEIIYKKTFKEHEKHQKLLEEKRENSSSLISSSQTMQNACSDSNFLDCSGSESVDNNAKDNIVTSTGKKRASSLNVNVTNKKRAKQTNERTKLQNASTLKAPSQNFAVGKMEQDHQSTENSTEESHYFDIQYQQDMEKTQQLQENFTKPRESEESSEAPAESNELRCQIDNLLKEIEIKAINCENLKKKVCELEDEKKKLENDLDKMQKENENLSNDAHEFSNNYTLINTRLKKLRQNVGCLLIKFIPALDLQQVNYDCDVIDEILQQTLDDLSSTITIP